MYVSTCLKFSYSTKSWQGKASANQHTKGASDKNCSKLIATNFYRYVTWRCSYYKFYSLNHVSFLNAIIPLVSLIVPTLGQFV